MLLESLKYPVGACPTNPLFFPTDTTMLQKCMYCRAKSQYVKLYCVKMHRNVSKYLKNLTALYKVGLQVIFPNLFLLFQSFYGEYASL